jgi:hypothetical protein
VPDYRALLTRDEVASLDAEGIRPVRLDVQPLYPQGFRGPGSPIQGARIEADFTIRSLDPNGRYLLGVFAGQQPLGPISLDFATYR